MKFFKSLTFICLFLSTLASAREVAYLARSTKGLLLGDAFTARAADEFALFYNPALLGRSNDVRFLLLNPTMGVTNALDDIDRFTNFPSDIDGIVDRLMGFPVYVNIGAFPFVKMGPIAFTLVKNYTNTITMRNAIHPSMRWDYRLDSGFILGAAFSFGAGGGSTLWGPKIVRKKKKKQAAQGARTSFGFSIKHLTRAALSGDYDLYGTTFFGALNSGASSINDFRNSLGFSKGSGWGLDLGADYSYTFGSSNFSAGISVMDVADTRFSKTQGIHDIPVQEMMVNSGLSFSQNFGVFDYTFSLDMHPMLSSIDTLRKMHLGLELSVPFLKIYTGWNAGYLSYGTEFDLWIFSIIAGIHGVEVGGGYRQEQGKRFILYASLFDFNFEP